MNGCLPYAGRFDGELVTIVGSDGVRTASFLPGCKLSVDRLQPGDDGLDQFLQGGKIF